MDDILKQTHTNKDISELIDQIREFNGHIVSMNQIAISLSDHLRSLEKSLVCVTTSLQSSIYQEQKDHWIKPKLDTNYQDIIMDNDSRVVL